MRRFAYLHGFASGPGSYKGTRIAERWASELSDQGVHLERPDLNQPSFAELRFTDSLAHLDALDAAGEGAARWCLIGSSMGGYLAARWAELRPDRVERLVLLCPGFDINRRWMGIFGPAAMARWRAEGELAIPPAHGDEAPTRVHWGFIEDALRHPAWPEVPCPTVIIHGTRDEVVPIASSREYVQTRPHLDVELIEVDDDHGLVASLDLIDEVARRHFGLAPS